ncbi:MAG TPA: hypothetical protein VGH19_00205 [Verrucomicrobiae bacterium]
MPNDSIESPSRNFGFQPSIQNFKLRIKHLCSSFTDSELSALQTIPNPDRKTVNLAKIYNIDQITYPTTTSIEPTVGNSLLPPLPLVFLFAFPHLKLVQFSQSVLEANQASVTELVTQLYHDMRRYLKSSLWLLIVVIVAFYTITSHALETPPNLRWQHTISTNENTLLTDCKILPDGNIAIAGKYKGTEPLFGSAHVSGHHPVSGTFIAVNTPAGELLWLQRMVGDALPKLSTDDNGNICLSNYAFESVTLLGTTIPAETDAAVLYTLVLKPDGTLERLSRLGRLEFTPDHPFDSLKTLFLPEDDGYLVGLEFRGKLKIEETELISSSPGQDVLWLKIGNTGQFVWHHQFRSPYYTFLGSLQKTPAGDLLGYVNWMDDGTFNSTTYDIDGMRSHSLLVRLASSGAVQSATHVKSDISAGIAGLLRNTSGDLVLQIIGAGTLNVGANISFPLATPLFNTDSSITIACVSSDLTARLWQTDFNPGHFIFSTTDLRADAAGNIYTAMSTHYQSVLAGQLIQQNLKYLTLYPTMLLKLSPVGTPLWIRTASAGRCATLDITATGKSYLFTNPDFATSDSTFTSLASSLQTSAPEFHARSLTNQVVATGSTLHLNPVVNGAADTIFYWFKDDEPLTNSSFSSLILTNVSSADLSSYTLIASNQFGSISAGPFRFTLTPPSRLSDIGTADHINTELLYRIDGRFSPNGKNHVVAGLSYTPIFRGPEYYLHGETNMTFCLLQIGDSPSRFFMAGTPSTGNNPKAVITDAGTCFVVDGIASTTKGWIASYDQNGNKLWEHVTTGGAVHFSDIAVNSQGQLCVLASSEMNFTINSSTITGGGIYLLKFSIAGELMSHQKLLSPSANLVWLGVENLRLAPDDSIFISGRRSDSHSLIAADGTTVPPAVNKPLFLAHFNSSGQMRWCKVLPEHFFHLITPMDCDVHGVVWIQSITGQTTLPDLPPLEADRGGIVVIRWNNDGTLAWHRLIDSPGKLEIAHAVTLDAAGNMILGLGTEGILTLGGQTFPLNDVSSSHLESLLVRFSKDGDYLDAWRPAADGLNVIASLTLDPKGRLLFTGVLGWTSDPVTTLQMGHSRFTQDIGSGGFYGITAPLGPPLSVKSEGGSLLLNWSPYLSDFTLESSPSPNGPWTPVTNTTSYISIPTDTSTSQFFRLKQQSE